MSGENKAEISILPSSGITSLRTDGVNWIAVGPDADGQRVDNYLARVAKGVPKSHIYRIIRAGEVRVNKARVKAETKLVEGDLLRVPPIRISQKPAGRPAAVPLAEGTVPVCTRTDIFSSSTSLRALPPTAARAFRTVLSSACAPRVPTNPFLSLPTGSTARPPAPSSSVEAARHSCAFTT